MIVDCFTFYNEIKMLLFRLEYLWNTVDYFVIVEATTTHAGNPKSLFFNESRTLFEKYMSKIVHVGVDDMPQTTNAWVPENFQRDCIDRGIKRISLSDDDLIIISDADEIPNRDTLKGLCGNLPGGVCALSQSMFYYTLSGRLDCPWTFPKVLTYKTYLESRLSPNTIRGTDPVKTIENGGWHFSYFGSTEFIANKIKNFAHQEFNSSEYTDIDKIKSRMISRTDVYSRHWVQFQSGEVDPTSLPEHYEMLLNM